MSNLSRWAVIGLLFAALALRGQGFSPDEAPRHMTLPNDLQVQLVAGEPMIAQPVCIEFDGSFAEPENGQWLFLLPGGEGQDEISPKSNFAR